MICSSLVVGRGSSPGRWQIQWNLKSRCITHITLVIRTDSILRRHRRRLLRAMVTYLHNPSMGLPTSHLTDQNLLSIRRHIDLP